MSNDEAKGWTTLVGIAATLVLSIGAAFLLSQAVTLMHERWLSVVPPMPFGVALRIMLAAWFIRAALR